MNPLSFSSLRGLLLAGFLFVAIAALGGCALPQRPTLPESSASTAWADTPLGKTTAAQLPDDTRSGFRMLPVASFAFDTRLALAEKATHTLDVQYYILSKDDTGRALLGALGVAARRGVRVRLLVDDLYSTGEDDILRAFAGLPNVEVRLFNPFAGGRDATWTRLIGASLDLARVNRRMHNKLFIADNAAALAGGRNIANEYFMHATASNFVDMDLFVAGPAVRDLSKAFDRYWNSNEVFPLSSISPLGLARDSNRSFDALVGDAKGPALDDLPEEFRPYGTLAKEIRAGHLNRLILGQATVVADDPDKARLIGRTPTSTVTNAVLAQISKAQTSVMIVSPYFVPGERGMAMMHEANMQHGAARIFTNSLASTDEPLAEEAYIQYRKRMLQENVELFEMSPSLTRERERLGDFGKSNGSLHAKCVVFDNKMVFLGSLNLDARSAIENTEVGIFVESPQMAEQLVKLLDLGSFYRLSLDDEGQVQWTATTKAGPIVYHEDPETTVWQRLLPTMLGSFVPEDQL